MAVRLELHWIEVLEKPFGSPERTVRLDVIRNGTTEAYGKYKSRPLEKNMDVLEIGQPRHESWETQLLEKLKAQQ